MSTRYYELVALLRELFQLDHPELDFGIYRIMQVKRDEVTQFLEQDLLPQVKQAFESYQSADKAVLEKQLQEAIAQARELGLDPDTIPKVQRLREEISSAAVDVSALEADVYNHLYRFFRRYYQDGDFISRRVYKDGIYAIPYEGEEVKLYWANHDQYYVKTSEYLRDYTFRLRPNNEKKPMRVHFKLVDAAEGTHNDVIESNKRVFVLTADDFIGLEKGPAGDELVIRFEYRPATLDDWPDDQRENKKKPPTQQDLLAIAEERILGVDAPALAPWIRELAIPYTKASGEQADYSRLWAHLKRYTERNMFDYFIHKDLGGFLRRELDFYIKNEVMQLDDIENESAAKVEQYLSKIKVIRKIAHKIIDFLAQLEDFQKKLWLKQKFVIATDYCVSVQVVMSIDDSVTRDWLIEQILNNERQIVEWVELLAIDEIGDDLASVDYSRPLKKNFLKSYPTLMVDTRYFDDTFKARLLESISNVDDEIDGILIHGENFQALKLLRTRYEKSIDCIHIDPPYNTHTSGFLYKNSYQHSSWLSMMANRLELAWELISERGHLLIHIDENEQERLHLLCENLGFPNTGTIVWDKKNPMLGRRGIATQHEYILWRNPSGESVFLRNANQRMILHKAQQIIEKHGGVTDKAKKEFSDWVVSSPQLSGGEKAYRYLDDDGRVYQSASLAAPERRTDPKFFVPLLHPVTKKPCPVPPNGWSRTPETMRDLLAENAIIFGPDESVQPRRKIFLTEESKRQLPSVIQDGSRGKTDVDKLGLEFPYCHPVSLYTTLIGAATPAADSTVLDFFAGSGTTGHAVINLNREDGGRRKFILVEMGEHFDTVLLPRLKKIAFSPHWKHGKPVRLPNEEESLRGPRIYKIVRLESYEDTLNNLEITRVAAQASLLEYSTYQGLDRFREQYMLRYMLDVETRGSQSLLNTSSFFEPSDYRLVVRHSGSDESQEVRVDLLETFNWLIGLRVHRIRAPQRFTAEFKRIDDPDLPKDAARRLVLDGGLRQDPNGRWWFRAVEGQTRDGRKTLVIWRNRPGGEDPEGVEKDNLVLDEWFRCQGYLTNDSEFDLIYVNGTSNLGNLKTPEGAWNVRLIEEDFHRLMFSMED